MSTRNSPAGKSVVAADVERLGQNIDNFINGINRLLGSADLMKKMVNDENAKVRQFTWDRTVATLMETYSAVSKLDRRR